MMRIKQNGRRPGAAAPGALMALTLALALILGLAPRASAAEGVVITTGAEQYGPAPCLVRADVSGLFADASIVSIRSADAPEGGQITAAVADRGFIEFYVRAHGTFALADTGETVSSMTLTGNLESTSAAEKSYKGAGSGTAEDPLTVLADFANLSSNVKKLQATWKSFNVFAGFDLEGTETVRDGAAVRKILVEDRDEATGRLLGSFYIDGALWDVTPGDRKGPYYLNYILDPGDEDLTSGYALDNHFSYTSNAPGGEERRAAALDLIKRVRDSRDSVLFLLSRLRDFGGPLAFKIYVGDTGKLNPGDKVAVAYLLGSSNRNIYHGIKPDIQTLLAEESTYGKYYQDAGLTAIVDPEGYLSFTLYNGGYFALAKITGDAADMVWGTPDFSNITGETTAGTREVYFTDVPIKHWAYIDIYAMAQEGIIGGYENGQFRPEAGITRAEFLKLLLSALKTPIRQGSGGFADAERHWAKDYIHTAHELGYVSGISETAFGVNDSITREQMAVILCRAKSLSPLSADGIGDGDRVSSWARGYIGACMAAKYVTAGDDGSFRPGDNLTRAEAAAVIHKIYNIG
jgi:hypothetical protein